MYLARRKEVLACAAAGILSQKRPLTEDYFAVAHIAAVPFEDGGAMVKGALLLREGLKDIVFEVLEDHVIDPSIPPDDDNARYLYRPLPNHEGLPVFLAGMHLYVGQRVRHGDSIFCARQDLFPALDAPMAGDERWEQEAENDV